MADLYRISFRWPHSEPTTVIVTGTFDQWSSSMQLTKGPTGFHGSTTIPWDEKIAYKFIVDGQWMVVEHEPTELDHNGNVNNVYMAPPKPSSSALETDSPVLVSATDHPAVTGGLEVASDPHFPQIVADMADTVAAFEGTTSALDYVASGLGAAIHGVVGIDPINAEQIALPSPNPDTPSGTVKEQVPPVPEVGSSVTSDVAVAIAPVALEGNRTVTNPVLQTSPEEVPLPAVSTEGIIDLTLEEPSNLAAIFSTTPNASAVDETAVINSDSRPSATQAGPLSDEPPMVTTLLAPLSTREPVIEISASPEAPPESKEASQPEALTMVAVNDTFTPKLDSASSRKTAEDVAAPDSLADEILQVDGTTEGVKPVTNGSQSRNESYTNGHDATPATALVVETQVQTPSPPTTPAKKFQQPFPSSSSDLPTKSFASQVGTGSRKKRSSIFGKVKHLFSHDKEKEKEKK